MKKQVILLTAAILLLFVNLKAQDKTFNDDFIFEKQFRFSLSSVLYDNLKLNNQGVEHLKSLPTFSGELSLSYYRHINNGYGINIGAGLGLASFNLNYYFKSPENSIFRTGIYGDYYKYMDLKHYEYFSIMYVFPVYFSKIFSYNKFIFSIGMGAKYHLLLAKTFSISGGYHYYIDENNNDVQSFGFYLEEVNNKHLVSYFLKLGIIKMTKKAHSCHFNLVTNYSPQKIGKGWYKFYNLGYESSGTVEQNINYVGFEFIYGLTLSKRFRNKK